MQAPPSLRNRRAEPFARRPGPDLEPGLIAAPTRRQTQCGVHRLDFRDFLPGHAAAQFSQPFSGGANPALEAGGSFVESGGCALETRPDFGEVLGELADPLIQLPGGVGNLGHLVEGVAEGHASAVLAASIFHFGTFTVREAKNYMAKAGIPMRLDASASDTFTLERLRDIVAARAASNDAGSYTRSLIDGGIARISKKFGEEAVEAVIAACSGDTREMISESADVLYHLMVLLHAKGIALEEVFAELQRRTRQSGLQEKAARKAGAGQG